MDENRLKPIAEDRYDKRDPRMALAAAAFEAATSPSVRRKLADSKQPIAVVVRVPTPAWVAPVADYCQKVFGRSWILISRDGTDRQHRSDKGSDVVAFELTKHSVVGVAADVGVLPSTLVAAADLTIELGSSGSVVSDAVARFGGKPHNVDFSGLTVVGVDFPDILATFRSGWSARKIRDRLAVTSGRIGADTAAHDLPDLRLAVEFGEARRWALALAKDIEDYRAKRIPWSALDRGAVVFSEPGLGKSLWARMVARECRVPLLESSVAEWFNGTGYIHDVIRAERLVFAQARTLASQADSGCCILFLDECDAIPNRATMSDRNRDYWTPILGDILTNLDNGIAGTSNGKSKRTGIIVIGATNRIADLDAALMRPGRLERAIEIRRPDFVGTLNILRFHVAGDVAERDLEEIAGLIEGATGAEVMQYVRDGRRIARARGGALSPADLRAAVLPKSDFAPDTLRRICVHEAGHAVATLALGCAVVKRCVVRSGTDSLGETLSETTENDLPTKSDIEDRVVAILSGRAAEEIVFGVVSANAGGDIKSDLATASRFVGVLHFSVGLGGSLVHVVGPNDIHQLLRTDPLLQRKVGRHLKALYRRALRIMTDHRGAIEAVAQQLSKRRHLSGDEIRRIYEASIAGRAVGCSLRQ
ncbi:AAA family ATPase [Bradyrhizobium sp. CB82]|uniref:AAA family ATPase n=1 Tax=Bradyrhizobium sp. CB82 TaxID=3039159 RepID=UPI0024B0C81F|nr:AAA family ATPase [Bradyrhizobium sp. CB82]WFU41452.1 AAA family ATPase [Bradyrhizobium sp. CB82]